MDHHKAVTVPDLGKKIKPDLREEPSLGDYGLIRPEDRIDRVNIKFYKGILPLQKRNKKNEEFF